MHLKRASVALFFVVTTVGFALWLLGPERRQAQAPSPIANESDNVTSPSHVSDRDPATSPPQTEPSPSDSAGNGITKVDANALDDETVQEAVSDWETIVTAAGSDRTAARSLDYVSSLCQVLQRPRENPGRFDDPRWIAVAKRCPSKLPDIMQILATSIPPNSVAISELTQAREAGDITRGDAIAAALLKSSNDPDELEAATSSYFDAERLRALAGDERPASLVGNDGALALQIDLALMVSCSLGTDCAPHTPVTLVQCATTTLCYPGQSMQQIIAMRRSPEEMAYLRRILDYVHQMRKRGN